MTLHDHPRSAGYDPEWMVDNCMGPNPRWLLEDLAEHLDLQQGMRVLDLGCGRAMTSIFLAREFDVRVWAADLWVPPTEDWRRVVDAGLESSIVPPHAEANDLPFAHGFFDAVVSVDSYHYFGTEDLYIGTSPSSSGRAVSLASPFPAWLPRWRRARTSATVLGMGAPDLPLTRVDA